MNPQLDFDTEETDAEYQQRYLEYRTKQIPKLRVLIKESQAELDSLERLSSQPAMIQRRNKRAWVERYQRGRSVEDIAEVLCVSTKEARKRIKAHASYMVHEKGLREFKTFVDTLVFQANYALCEPPLSYSRTPKSMGGYALPIFVAQGEVSDRSEPK